MSQTKDRPKTATCLWFDDKAMEAVEFYCSFVPKSRIDAVTHYPNSGKVLTISFTLGSAPYVALNGGSQFKFTEAASIYVFTEDQAETDRLWSKITANGGEEGACGWVRDRFGLWWQIVPKRLLELLEGPACAKIWPVLMKSKKIELAAFEEAAAT